MNPLIQHHREELTRLCRAFRVQRLDVFGSAVTGGFDLQVSDLDFIVTFSDTQAGGYADRYLGLAEALEREFHRPVDLLTERSIRNPAFRQAVESQRERVYDERD